MFERLTKSAISKIKNPYGQIFVIIAFSLFWIIRADRERERSQAEKVNIFQEIKIEMLERKIDSLNKNNQQLNVDKAEIKARGDLANLNQIIEFNKILDSLKNKIRR